jgi:hypothetical protein
MDRPRSEQRRVSDVTYRMLAADTGVKWRGLSVNAQYFFRWLNNFRADGPLPNSAIPMNMLLVSNGTSSETIVSGSSQRVCGSSNPQFPPTCR